MGNLVLVTHADTQLTSLAAVQVHDRLSVMSTIMCSHAAGVCRTA